ncbi:MAG: NADH-quinone oxidoreductase subunit L [Candidatus Cloacimonetes bacterium]|nr:NADH-quinone oxidoreductase subunit L [Candidatus Cloacimonadota bacterium]
MMIFFPMLAGIILFLIPETLKAVKGIITILISVYILYLAFSVFSAASGLYQMQCTIPYISSYLILNVDGLSKLIVIFLSLFSFLFALYSYGYLKGKQSVECYYSYYVITIGAAMGAALAENLLFFIFCWGILGLTLYKLIKGHNEESSSAAKKAFILIGGSDSILILGIGLIFKLTGTYNISAINISTSGALANAAFLCLLIAALTKAGAIPFHTWVPDYVEHAPASSSAFLPASLDKLLGIYLLARICIQLFSLTAWATMLLMIIGSLTIICAVMMALVQHNYKKLLGYHAVSQVGYMVTGLALGTPLGIAAGLFHLINHALYKGGLFLSAGSIEKQTGEEEIDNLGGLSKLMPLTFFSMLVFALSISGIPPFNGFYSKWMIYRGIIDFGSGPDLVNKLWILWLGLAVFGSVLTLASFIKLISGVFLGRFNQKFAKIKEVKFTMWLPQLILASLCIFFGVFAATAILPTLFNFAPISGAQNLDGLWQSPQVSILILISIVLGFVIYAIGNIGKHRREDSFIGGENIQDETNFAPSDFYKTITEFKLIAFFYNAARKKWFDIYYLGKGFILGLFNIFSACHTGILSTYLVWVAAGLAIILLILI